MLYEPFRGECPSPGYKPISVSTPRCLSARYNPLDCPTGLEVSSSPSKIKVGVCALLIYVAGEFRAKTSGCSQGVPKYHSSPSGPSSVSNSACWLKTPAPATAALNRPVCVIAHSLISPP